LAKPKSPIFISLLEVINILAYFKSRWTIFFRCIA